MEEPMQTEADQFHLMPWHFSPENTACRQGLHADCDHARDEIQTISLHVGMLPEQWWSSDPAVEGQ